MRFSPQVRHLEWLLRRPIAHRGLHDANNGAVENSRTAFARAIAGHFAIECDLQLSADGEAMVFHDFTLDRVTLDKGRIDAKTAKDLSEVKYRVGSDVMMTLQELLDQVSGQVPLLIEIKSEWDGNPLLVRRACDVLTSYDGPFAVMSFDPDVVTLLAEIAPSIVRGIVADRYHDKEYDVLSVAKRVEMREFAHLESSRPHFISFDYHGLPYAPVQQIRQQGFPVICWTIRSEEDASHAMRYCDQITFEGFIAA